MIVGVSILGNPAALDVMKDFADRHGLYLLEDNCESMDAELNGRKTGTFGHLNTFSFFSRATSRRWRAASSLPTTRNCIHLLRSVRAHGWTRDLPKGSPLFEPRGSDHFEAYRFILPGYNVRPMEFSGAIGREQLKKLPCMTVARRRNLGLFQKLFAGDSHSSFNVRTGRVPAFPSR